MSSFSTLESSRESSRPLEIYQFTLGTEVFRYTSAEDTLMVGADTFSPVAMQRGRIEQGSDSQARNLIITMPGNDPLSARYRNVVPGLRCSLSLWRLQRDETPTFNTKLLMYRGQIMSVRFPQDGYNAELTIRSIEQALNRNVPRFTFASVCNHVLYDSRCGVNQDLFDFVGTVTALSGNTITVPGLNAQPDQFYRGGYVRPVSGEQDFRLVLSHVGNVLTLLLPFANSPLNGQVQAFAGCDHIATSHCALKFDNVARFGGFAFVPNRNPFTTGLT